MKIPVLLSALALSAVLLLSGQQSPDSGQQSPDSEQQSPDPSTQFPDGEGKDLVIERCGACHGLEQVAAHPGTSDEWGSVIYAMTGNGLQVTGEDAQLIIAYLAKSFPPPPKAVVTLPDGAGKDLVLDRCAACHALDQVAAHKGSKEDWEGVVEYMASRGMSCTPEERSLIVQYLSKSFPPAETAKDKGKASDKGKTQGKEKGKGKPPEPPK